MRLLWSQLQLPLLILIQLLEAKGIHREISSEALLRYPCRREPACVNCYELKELGVVPLTHPLPVKTRLREVSSLMANILATNSPTQLQEKSRYTSRGALADGDSNVPTLTPLQENDSKKPRKQKVAGIAGGIGAALLVLLIVVLVYICLMRVRRSIRRTSEEGTSLPSPHALERNETSLYDERRFNFLELQHATSNFSQNNMIGEGRFGFFYKGLLQDGSIVAIKRSLHTPTQYVGHQLNRIAQTQHVHLVKLVGYYEDNHQLILVYDYEANQNVGNHLYDNDGLPIGRLSMQQRLSIALGAAKGLEHLHGLNPPLLHMHFRTSNVLLSENFTAKLSDYGLSLLIKEGHRAGSSSTIDGFLDPELSASLPFLASSDVYGFGVFLLELISGRASNSRNGLQARNCGSMVNFADHTIVEEGKMKAADEMMKLALRCLDVGERRPSMGIVVEKLEDIQDKEFGVEIGPVTLGSELFK